jgi:endoglucanase
MVKTRLFTAVFLLFSSFLVAQSGDMWIRVNQLGYSTKAPKVAVLGSKSLITINKFEIVDNSSKKVVFSGSPGSSFGAYGPFKDTYRLNFSSFRKKGKYYIKVENVESPPFEISNNVYDSAADFCLRYMRQQRSGFNPYLKDSCHTYDGYTLFAPVPDSTHIDVVGGWHDATDYLQYSTTSANATFHLLAAYRDFPKKFTDTKNASGLDGRNNIADVMDEAKWGLDWLMKMHPKPGWLFNQLADDRDHSGMRLPKLDSAYGRGYERPVYFCNGKPQMRGKFMNNTTGAASTAGKFAAAFALGSLMFDKIDRNYADKLFEKSGTALQIGFDMPGAAQTASVKSPYIYAEDNWKDDMELGAISLYNAYLLKNKTDQSKRSLADSSFQMASDEPLTPWFGADTAKHYQWYPFINVGHYELAKALKDKRRDSVIAFYKQGIEKVWSRAKNNAFYRAIPFIWCSNNLTVSFATQCYWYRKLTNDNTYLELERACFDWIFGCNPWGTSMVYGLPSYGDTPVDPHSSFTHIAKYPVDGGLVDGPVYTSIFDGLIGLRLANEDEYAQFQSGLAVYHDDVGDYSTNEPTMDGTASLIYLLAAMASE